MPRNIRGHLLLIVIPAMLLALTASAAGPPPVGKLLTGTTAKPCATSPDQELAFPCQKGEIRDVFLHLADGTVEVVAVEVFGQSAVLEGDILLHLDEDGHAWIAQDFEGLWLEESMTETLPEKSAFRSNTSFRWACNRIPFNVVGMNANDARVTWAVNHYATNTNLRLVPRNGEASFVTIRQNADPDTCSSEVGRQGGQQFIELGNNCTQGNLAHEIGHAAGLWHEQSRTDRDNSITIHWNDIQVGREDNFRTYTQLGNDGTNHGAYDLNSIMHYGSFAFSANGNPTITRLDGSTFAAQRNGLTAGDMAGVNNMYPARIFRLTASGAYFSRRLFATLSWTACNPNVTQADVFRNGVKVATTAYTGGYTDIVYASSPGSINYWVCEAGSTTWYDPNTCTDVQTVYF